MVCCYQKERPRQHRGTVKVQNIDGYGEIYDKMRIVEPKAEDDILRSFMRTSTHAARNHWERVGAIVTRLFEQNTDMEMEFIKAEVFGVEGGALIMAKDHPALQELFKLKLVSRYAPCCALLCSKTLSAATFICRREV